MEKKTPQEEYDELSAELVKYPTKKTKQAIILEFCEKRGIKPSHPHTPTELKRLKSKYPTLFGDKNE